MDMPSPRRLVLAWAVLCTLTVVSMAAGTLGAGLTGAALILAMTLVKARQILDIYLNLKAASVGWRALFTALVVAILGIVLAALALAGLLPAA
ncbi:cytochrome C oxidase subunit IV family protein [Novispirillum sp. DQ9]|uniref:cytochrome C oxidase subunit IV family protein n=1 Tax=Novispirillum sp. DQ9 TaxID=3398612 RepID=UPI003C7C17CA